jgi:hypothetical protein
MKTPMGRTLPSLSIQAEEQTQLGAWTRKLKTAQSSAKRTRVVLRTEVEIQALDRSAPQ